MCKVDAAAQDCTDNVALAEEEVQLALVQHTFWEGTGRQLVVHRLQYCSGLYARQPRSAWLDGRDTTFLDRGEAATTIEPSMRFSERWASTSWSSFERA